MRDPGGPGVAWRLLNRVLLVPLDPPDPPPGRTTWTRTFRPHPAFLRYLVVTAMAQTLTVMVIAIGFGTVVVVGIDGSPPPLLIAVALFVLALMALGGLLAVLTARLRYDATWYVMTDRSLRNRRGVWTIRENTVSFDNIQNLRVRQGPIQRWLGIEDLVLETAAAGAAQADEGAQASTCVVEGIRGARELRDRIADRMRRSGAGLGEGRATSHPPRAARPATPRATGPLAPDSPLVSPTLRGTSPFDGGLAPRAASAIALGPEHLRLLREILAELRDLQVPPPPGAAAEGARGSGEGPPRD